MTGFIFYVPEAVATKPADGEVITNRWWLVHEEKGLAFYSDTHSYYRPETPAPQCHHIKNSAIRLFKKYEPEHIIKLIPVVFLYHAKKLERMVTVSPAIFRDRLVDEILHPVTGEKLTP